MLVARHEPAIGGDHRRRGPPRVRRAPHDEGDRRRARSPNEWFTEDFTLAELKTLRAKERLPDIRQRNTIYNGRYDDPDLPGGHRPARPACRATCTGEVGIIPELKHSTYFRVDRAAARGAVRRGRCAATTSTTARAKVTVQSFEIANLKALDRQLPGVPLVQLLDAKTRIGRATCWPPAAPLTYGEMATPEGLREDRALRRRRQPVEGLHRAARHDDGAARSRRPRSSRDAHAAGLDVVAYTFRNENTFLPLELRRGADPIAWGTRSPSTRSSPRSASTACSRTIPTPRRPRATTNEPPVVSSHAAKAEPEREAAPARTPRVGRP